MTQKQVLRVGEGGLLASAAKTKKQETRNKDPAMPLQHDQLTAASVFSLSKGLFFASPWNSPYLVYL